jgi:hypothetical protein
VTTPSSGAETVKQSFGTTLHDRLRAELDRRLALANAAETFRPSPWNCPGPPFDDRVEDRFGSGVAYDIPGDGLGPYIALHDPADALRRYAGELEVLERHFPVGDGEWCAGQHLMSRLSDCPEIRSLASRLGVSVDA